MTFILIHPDSSEEILLSVPKLNFNWRPFSPAGDAAHAAARQQAAGDRALRQLGREWLNLPRTGSAMVPGELG